MNEKNELIPHQTMYLLNVRIKTPHQANETNELINWCACLFIIDKIP